MAADKFKMFVSEEEIEEQRNRRKEEWEKVHGAGTFKEEEVQDTRSLHEKLQQQKDEAQAGYEEKYRLSNQVRGLDEDEADFLATVSDQQMQIEKKREQEDMELISEVKAASSNVANSKSSKPLSKACPNKKENSQKSILSGAVKRKSTEVNECSSPVKKSNSTAVGTSDQGTCKSTMQVTQPIGVLPGLGYYSDSSDDSSGSSDSDIELQPKRVVHLNLQVKSGEDHHHA